MAKRIEKLEEIAKLPLGTIVYYKEGTTLSIQDDSYDVGMVVSSRLSKRLREGITRLFKYAITNTYASNVMNEIRQEGRIYTYNWDKLSEPNLLGRNWKKKGIPKGRNLVVMTAPVPENGDLAKKFAERLEEEMTGLVRVFHTIYVAKRI